MLGSNFSSSADEPQIPHGEILIPFFQCSVKKASRWLVYNPPFFCTSFTTYKDCFYTSNQALILKEENSAFSYNCTLPSIHAVFQSVMHCLFLHTEHVTSWYFVIFSLLDGRSASDPFLPFELCSEEYTLKFLQSLYNISTTENSFKTPLFSRCWLTSGTAFLCSF